MKNLAALRITTRQWLFLGAALATIVLVGLFSETFAGDVLAPALAGTVALAVLFVSVNLARYTQQQAEAAVQQADAAEAQLAELRAQNAGLVDATRRSGLDADEAQRLTRLSIETSLRAQMDANAPNAALLCRSATFAPVGEPAHPTERRTYSQDEAASVRYRLSAQIVLVSYDDKPLIWSRPGVVQSELPHGGLRGVILPGAHDDIDATAEFFVDRTMTLQAWQAQIEAHTEKSSGGSAKEGFIQTEVMIETNSYQVSDHHVLVIYPPPISRDGSHYVVDRVHQQYEPVGLATRRYRDHQLPLSEPTTDEV